MHASELAALRRRIRESWRIEFQGDTPHRADRLEALGPEVVHSFAFCGVLSSLPQAQPEFSGTHRQPPRPFISNRGVDMGQD